LDNSARSKGYLQARFYDPKVEETSDGLIITLHVDEGILYRLGEIRIEGSSLLSSDKIIKMMPLKPGEIANGERLSEFLYDELKKFYGEHGYIQYTTEVTPEFRSTPNGPEGIVDFAITIDEGQRFRLRKIGFKFDGEITGELRQLLLVHEGDIYNQTLFEKSIERLNETGLFESIDKDKDVDFRVNDEEGLIELTIKLTKKPN
jgi:outer membrane protein insertion porin family